STRPRSTAGPAPSRSTRTSGRPASWGSTSTTAGSARSTSSPIPTSSSASAGSAATTCSGRARTPARPAPDRRPRRPGSRRGAGDAARRLVSGFGHARVHVLHQPGTPLVVRVDLAVLTLLRRGGEVDDLGLVDAVRDLRQEVLDLRVHALEQRQRLPCDRGVAEPLDLRGVPAQGRVEAERLPGEVQHLLAR